MIPARSPRRTRSNNATLTRMPSGDVTRRIARRRSLRFGGWASTPGRFRTTVRTREPWLFPDANVLFSAAYREAATVTRLWRLPGAQHCASEYAVEEARRDLRVGVPA